jgi:hypothetical protein
VGNLVLNREPHNHYLEFSFSRNGFSSFLRAFGFEVCGLKVIDYQEATIIKRVNTFSLFARICGSIDKTFVRLCDSRAASF